MSETDSAGRYARTTNGLIGSLIVTLLAIGVFVVFRALTSNDLEVSPEPVDYLETVSLAQDAGLDVVYPARLPKGWIATTVDVVPGPRPEWGIGMLTDAGEFVGIRQENASVDDLLVTYVDEDPAEGDPVDVAGSVATHWRAFSDSGGDHAYAAEVGDGGDVGHVGRDTVLVYGSAGTDELREILELLTTAGR